MKVEMFTTRGRSKYESRYTVPGAITIDVVDNDEIKKSAVKGWTVRLDGKTYEGSTVPELVDLFTELANLYPPLRKICRSRVVLYAKDIRYLWSFIKNYVKISHEFVVNDEYLGMFLINNFIEIREVKALFRDSWVGFGDTDIDALYNSAKWAWTTCAWWEGEVKGDLPLTAQMFVAHQMKSRMTENDKDFVRAIIPSQRIYELVVNNIYGGGYTDKRELFTPTIAYGFGHVDFSGSYGARILTDYFPVSALEEWDISRLAEAIKTKCCYIHLQLHKLELKSYLRFLQSSKLINTKYNLPKMPDKNLKGTKRYELAERVYKEAYEVKKQLIKEANVSTTRAGRIYKADYIDIIVDELDYELLHDLYNWENKDDPSKYVTELFVADRGQLPEYVREVDEFFLYKKATTKGYERDFWKTCNEIVYGSMVKRIYGWESKKWDTEVVDKAFLSPLWGVKVSSWARYRLLTTAMMLGDDFLYAAVDSLYFEHPTAHITLFQELNRNQQAIMYKYCKSRGLDFEVFKNVGCFKWEDEPDDDGPNGGRFKCLAPNEYIYTYFKTVDGKKKQFLQTRISGFAKTFDGKNAWENEYTIDNIFDAFEYDNKITDKVVEKTIFDEEVEFEVDGVKYHQNGGTYVEKKEVTTSIKDRLTNKNEEIVEFKKEQYNKGNESR